MLVWQLRPKTIWHKKNCDSYHFMQFQYIPLFNLSKILRKRTQTTKNSWKWSFFVGLSTLSWWPRLQIKLKPIGYTTSCATFIISCNSNISKSLTCPKTCRKCPKRLKTKKRILFHKFEHFSLPTLTKYQNENHWHSYHFMQF